MPLFWVEQKFELDTSKAGELWFALNAPLIGQSIGIALLILGIILMSIRYLKRFWLRKQSKNFVKDIVHTEIGIVTKDQEMNPLMIERQNGEILHR